ncbi:MAG: hypothetical protein ABFS14_10890 [Gemmatimonadota bacterium]
MSSPLNLAVMASVAALVVAIPVPAASHAQQDPTGYVGTTTADELLVLSAGADLRSFRHSVGLPPDTLLEVMNDQAFALATCGVEWSEDGGWLLQPGRLSEHPDHLYAGHSRIPDAPQCSAAESDDPACQLEPAPVAGIGMDVSHFLAKWPFFFRVFMEASFDSPRRAAHYRALLFGIEAQLFGTVLTPPDDSSRVFRLTNYMDGTDGIYRWNYQDRGRDWGYEPGGLSGTPFYSSLAFIDSPRIDRLYRDIESLYPYEPGGLVSRRNVENGRLLVRLSQKLNFSGLGGEGLWIDEEDRRLFASRFEPALLADDAWIGRNAYSGVVGERQVVLHAAFLNNVPQWQAAFADHFRAFVADVVDDWPGTSRYDQRHQLAFAARYLALAARYGRSGDIPAGLVRYVEDVVLEAYSGNNEPVSRTGWGEPRFTNYRDWIDWKLDYNRCAPSWK